MDVSVHPLVIPPVTVITSPCFKVVGFGAGNDVEDDGANVVAVHVIVKVDTVIAARELLRVELGYLVAVTGSLHVDVMG